jgi:hypothetical protein
MSCGKLALSTLLPAFALAALVLCSPSHADVLDFENLAGTGTNHVFFTDYGSSVAQNGFTISGTDFIAWNPPDGGGFGNYTGSIALNDNFFNNITIAPTAGGTFTLNSIDVTNFYPQSSLGAGNTFPASVTFTGNVSGGGTSTLTYTLLATDALQTVTFDASFSNLTSLVFTDVQFDNVVVNAAAVPEPGSIALLVGMGLSSAGFLARRRKQARKAA